MDYKKYYDALCSSRQQLFRVKSKECYYEKHHILPRSLGGLDNTENLVLLTAKEHYIAHLLLYKFHKVTASKGLRKMAFALVSMLGSTGKVKRELSARSYATIREAAIDSRIGHKVENPINYKYKKSESHKEAIRQARLAAPPRSEETRKKLLKASQSANKFATNYTILTCPHCLKEGQATAMKRWHFNNCKVRKEVLDA